MSTQKKILYILFLIALVAAVMYWKKATAPKEPVPSLAAVEQTSISAPESSLPVDEEFADAPTDEDSEFKPVVEEAPVVIEQTAVAVVEEKPAEPMPSQIVFKGEKFDVKQELVLATVNNIEIKLKDLVPIAANDTSDQTVSAVEFSTRLQRAIDRELVFEAARTRNIMLDDEQKKLVEKSRLSAGAKGFGLPDDKRPAYEAESNFTSLELMGNLLSDGLAKASGGPAKDTTPEADYHKFVRAMLDDMRQKANVVDHVVVEP